MVLPLVQNPQVLDIVPPQEEALEPLAWHHASTESARLQIFPGAGGKRTADKEWQPVSGAGETAFFRNNGNEYAELSFWTATHHLTLQVSVPTGSTAEAIKPKVLTLANQVIAKLR